MKYIRWLFPSKSLNDKDHIKIWKQILREMFVTHGTLRVPHGLLTKKINIPSWDIIRNLLKYHAWGITWNTRPLPWDTSNRPVVPSAGCTSGTLIVSHGRLGKGLRYVISLSNKKLFTFENVPVLKVWSSGTFSLD